MYRHPNLPTGKINFSKNALLYVSLLILLCRGVRYSRYSMLKLKEEHKIVKVGCKGNQMEIGGIIYNKIKSQFLKWLPFS